MGINSLDRHRDFLYFAAVSHCRRGNHGENTKIVPKLKKEKKSKSKEF